MQSLHRDGQTDNQCLDQWMDRQKDRWANRWNNEWKMFLYHTDATDASENDDFPTDVVIFQKARRTGGPTDRKNRRTNQPMDRHTLL